MRTPNHFTLLLATLALPATLSCLPAAVLIDRTFDGAANDIGPAFQQVTNGLGAGGSSNTTTGVVTTGSITSSTYGFNNAATVNITTADPSATGFVATFEISSVSATVSTLAGNGFFFGVVSGTNATGTTGSSLWNNDPDAFGYVAGSANYGDHLMRQDGDTNTTLPAPAPTNASFANGFTVSISLFNDDTWAVSSTGLSTNLNSTGSLNTGDFSYADIVGGIGLYTSIQGQPSASYTVDRITLTTIPEPSGVVLILMGSVGLLVRRRRS